MHFDYVGSFYTIFVGLWKDFTFIRCIWQLAVGWQRNLVLQQVLGKTSDILTRWGENCVDACMCIPGSMHHWYGYTTYRAHTGSIHRAPIHPKIHRPPLFLGWGEPCQKTNNACMPQTLNAEITRMSTVWSQWRRKFTKQQNAADTKLIQLYRYQLEHIFDEAVARVVARHTYDAHDSFTLTGTPSRMNNDL